MINNTGEQLRDGFKYLCLANDIVNEWEVELLWVNGCWVHDNQNIDGVYPCIVTEVIRVIKPNQLKTT